MNQNNEPNSSRHSLRRQSKGERGQIIYMVVFMAMAMLAAGALVVDVGRVYVTYHELVASTNAAAMAGGLAMGLPNSTVTTTTTAANSYGSASGNSNAFSNLTGVTTTLTPKCLSSLQIACFGAGAYNAVQVTQAVTLPMTLASISGLLNVPLTATATASMSGSATVPYNIAIILDTTASMNDTDSSSQCNSTRLSCALGGISTFMASLYPCASSYSTCSVSNGVAASPVDQVSLFTFPNMTTTTNSNDYTCPTSDPTIVPYTFPTSTLSASTGMQNMPYTTTTTTGTGTHKTTTTTTVNATYQITGGSGSSGYLSDYRNSDTATAINTSSPISIAIGKSTTRNCGGVGDPGGESTYYAGAIYAAANSLLAQQAANPLSQNAIILISDGDAEADSTNMVTGTQSTTVATSGGTYPSWKNECAQAVTAAQAAAAQNIRVYSIAYGAESSGCSTDSPKTTPCQTMKSIASNPGYFFSDYASSGSGVDKTCAGSGAATTSINGIFQLINVSLGVSRLLPNGTT